MKAKGTFSLLLAMVVVMPGTTAIANQRQSEPALSEGAGSINLVVGLAESNGDLAQCGTSANLSTTVGDQINFCYTVTNNSNTTLDFQTLSDDVVGTIFAEMAQPIAPGESFQFNRIVTAGESESPTSTWTAQSSVAGYANSAGDYNFFDIAGFDQPLNLSEDGSALVTMPFTFTLYGISSDQLCINNNGFMLFAADTLCSGFNDNDAIPNGFFATPLIAPLWDNLYPPSNGNGNVYYATMGGEPGRQFLVEWKNVVPESFFPSPGYTFQVIFNEADGTIDFNYLNVIVGSPPTDGGGSATVGMQRDETLGNQYSFNSPTLTANQNIHWVATAPVVYSDSAQVTLNVGAPILSLNPTSLSGIAPSNGITTTTLTITNDGNRDLNWTLDEVAPNAHFPIVSAFIVPFHGAEQSQNGPVPQSARDTIPKPAQSRLPFGEGSVPAYAETFAPYEYVTFDANAPGALSTISPLNGAESFFTAGTFVDNDFSKEYVIDVFSAKLYSISTTDGAITYIADTNLGSNVNGMRWDPVTGNTYVINSGCAGSRLSTLDLTTGVQTTIGTSEDNCIIDIAIDSRGLMYGVDIVNDALVAIDKTTGDVQPIGSIGFNSNFAQGLDFDASTGILYFTGIDANDPVGRLYTIDTTTGAATLIGPMGPGYQADALAIAVANTPCSLQTDFGWLSVDPSNGTTIPAGSAPVTVTLDADGLPAGIHHAKLCLSTNDLNNRYVDIPVDFFITEAPRLSKAFEPASITAGATSVLTITLVNFSPITAELSVDLIDSFPPGLVVADQPNATTTCANGSVLAIPGDGSVTLSAGSQILATAGTCDVTVTVTSGVVGTFTNTIPIGALQTDLGQNADAASADLVVELSPTDSIFADGFD